MADVLLTHSNHVFSDRKQVEKMQPYPPLQTILAAGALRAAGTSVALYDPALEPPAVDLVAAFTAALERERPRLAVVCEDDFNFLSKMCLLRNRELAFAFAAAAKHLGVRVVAHGADASDQVAAYLNAGFDQILRGDVEPQLVTLASGALSHPIEWPRAAWDLVDIERYRRAWLAAHGYFSLNMVSSRGCPYRCNWCAKPVFGDSYRVRPAAEVAAELRHLKDAFQPDHIWFADDIFALSPKWAHAFADSVEQLDAHTPFRMQSRCDLMTRETVESLRRAGCEEVWMGAESGSQKILDAMEKGIRVEQIYAARENLRRHGVRACFFLQFGYPGETWNEVEATIRMVRETAPDDIGISVSYPLPGTKFFNMVSEKLGRVTNWSDSADLAMIYRGAYSSDFYRALADALHLEVRGCIGKSPEALAAAWQRVAIIEPCAAAQEAVAQ
jgi:hypothetical protein